MTATTIGKRRLNQDVKALYEKLKTKKGENFIGFCEGIGRREFIRIHNYDPTFRSFNAKSLRLMIAMNRCHGFIPHHRFGMFIDD